MTQTGKSIQGEDPEKLPAHGDGYFERNHRGPLLRTRPQQMLRHCFENDASSEAITTEYRLPPPPSRELLRGALPKCLTRGGYRNG